MNPRKSIFGISRLKLIDLGVPDELIKIYRKSKNFRTTKDNLLLIQRNDHLSCFQKILKTHKEGELIYETIIKSLDFMIYEPDKVIYYPKDMITNVFYIFHGSVKVDKTQYDNFPSPVKSRSQKIKEKRNSNTKNNTIISFKMAFSSPIKEDLSEEFHEKEDSNEKNKDNERKKEVRNLGFYKKLFHAVQKYKIYRENKNYRKKFKFNNDSDDEGIITLEKGDEYGQSDLNLLKRLDLVETKTTCIIGFLSKHAYKFIFEKTDALKKNDIYNFLKSLKILQEVNNEVVINNIYNAINERKIFRGEYLVKSGEKSDKFFIIRKGFFEVNISIKQKIKNQFNDLNYFGHYTLKEKSKNIKYEINNHYFNDETYKIVTYGEGEIIGDIELYLNSQKFLYDIFCNTDSSLIYEINFKDFNINSNRTMKSLLLQEGQQKLKYFRKRIHNIKIINSKKMDNINKFKEIISNKLEEEKGEIFNQIENNISGKYKYEKKQRKRLKSASINNKLINILKEVNEQKLQNNIFNMLNNKIERGRNNFLFQSNKEINNEYPMFPTSIKNNDYKLITYDNDSLNNNNNKKSLNTKFYQYIKKLSSNKLIKNNKNTISFFFKSSKNNNAFLYDKFHISHALSQNIKNLKSSKANNNNFARLKIEEIANHNQLSPKKRKQPMTLNEKFQNIFTKLFSNKKNRNPSIEDHESTNNINYYNTQDSSIKKVTEYSKNNLNTFSQNVLKSPFCETNNNEKILLSLKIEDRFFKNEDLPLLTEIIQKRKNIVFKKLSSTHNKKKNYKIKQ